MTCAWRGRLGISWGRLGRKPKRLVHRGTNHTAFLLTDDIFDGNFSTANSNGPVSIEPRQVFSILRSNKTTGSFSWNGPRKAFGFTMNGRRFLNGGGYLTV